MAGTPFIYTNPEAAKQAIAQLQLQAALAENQSRENIAKEQTTQQRYATQSQIADRDKDRAVAREDIASRSGARTAAEADKISRERANIQYSTIRESITEFDPPTKSELETRMLGSQLTDDLKNDLRSYREKAYKIAKANAANGELAAKNYKAELGALGKTPDVKTKDNLFKRLRSDKDVLFDAATGSVTSRWRLPREDGSAGAASGVPTIGDLRALVNGGNGALPPTQATLTTPAGGVHHAMPLSFGEQAAPAVTVHHPVSGMARMADAVALAPPTQSEILGLFERFPGAVPSDAITIERFPQAGRMGQRPVVQDPTAALSGFASNLTTALPGQRADSAAFLGKILDQANTYLSRMPRVSDIAPPRAFGPQELYGPPNRAAYPMIDAPVPRAYDLQTLRPEYVPMDDRYFAPQ